MEHEWGITVHNFILYHNNDIIATSSTLEDIEQLFIKEYERYEKLHEQFRPYDDEISLVDINKNSTLKHAIFNANHNFYG